MTPSPADASSTDTNTTNINTTNASNANVSSTDANYTDANITNTNTTDAISTNANTTDLPSPAHRRQVVQMSCIIKGVDYNSLDGLHKYQIEQSVIISIASEIDGVAANDVTVMLSAGSVTVNAAISATNWDDITHEIRSSTKLASTTANLVSSIPGLPKTGSISVTNIEAASLTTEAIPTPAAPTTSTLTNQKGIWTLKVPRTAVFAGIGFVLIPLCACVLLRFSRKYYRQRPILPKDGHANVVRDEREDIEQGVLANNMHQDIEQSRYPALLLSDGSMLGKSARTDVKQCGGEPPHQCTSTIDATGNRAPPT
jgi:hypothetical protein